MPPYNVLRSLSRFFFPPGNANPADVMQYFHCPLFARGCGNEYRLVADIKVKSAGKRRANITIPNGPFDAKKKPGDRFYLLRTSPSPAR